jgi:hypothetical protein
MILEFALFRENGKIFRPKFATNVLALFFLPIQKCDPSTIISAGNVFIRKPVFEQECASCHMGCAFC